jgi:hypothetical protein
MRCLEERGLIRKVDDGLVKNDGVDAPIGEREQRPVIVIIGGEERRSISEARLFRVLSRRAG